MGEESAARPRASSLLRAAALPLRLAVAAAVLSTMLFSGLLINAVQLLSLLLWTAGLRGPYRIVNHALFSAYTSQLVFCLRHLGRVRIIQYSDGIGSEEAVARPIISISNHRSDVDWLAGMDIAWRWRQLGAVKAMVKEQFMWIPCLGWMFWFCEFMFVRRAWEQDQTCVSRGLSYLAEYDANYFLVVFAESTRFTPDKVARSQQWAREHNLPVLHNVMLPRTKGFVAAVKALRRPKAGASRTPVIADITVMFPLGRTPSLLDALGFALQPSECHVLVQQIDVTNLPEEDIALEKWLVDRFIAKDNNIDHFLRTGSFPYPRAVAPPRESAHIFGFWFALFCCALHQLAFRMRSAVIAHSATLLGGAFSLFVLLIVTILLAQRSSGKGKSGAEPAKRNQLNGRNAMPPIAQSLF